MKAFTSGLLTLMILLCLTACKKEGSPSNPNAVPPPPGPGQDANTMIETYPPLLTPVVKTVNSVIGGYYESLPALYQYTTKTYPLIISLPGVDAEGDGNADLQKILWRGLPKLLKDKKFPPSFTVGQKSYSFIIISPQLNSKPTPKDINSFVNYLLKNYRIDSSRIYFVAHSTGAGEILDYAVDFGPRIAGIVPIATSYSTIDDDRAAAIASFNLPIWAFHNVNDPTEPVNTTSQFVELINEHLPHPPARKTLFETSGHDAWTRAVSPQYKEEGFNIYEWMLAYSR